MIQKSIIDAYERVYLPTRKSVEVSRYFLYVAHYRGSNHVQVGFGMEATSGLQLAHIPGPQVHEMHVGLLVDWLNTGQIALDGHDTLTRHAFSSDVGDLEKRMSSMKVMNLSAGRYAPIVANMSLDRSVLLKLQASLRKIQAAVWGHPLDWEVQRVSLGDGRLIWLAYDSAIQKIRVGIGYYNAANEPCYGDPSYAIAKAYYEKFVAWHYLYYDAAITLYGLPSGWPLGMSRIVSGKEKQKFVKEVLKLGDKIWT